MGEVDYENLHKIYRKCIDFCKENDLPYSFKVDNGDFETAIEFYYDDEKWQTYHPPVSKDWSTHPVIFCPDILDYTHKIIVEWEEEHGNRKNGAKLAKKGHSHQGDFDTKRDTRRTEYYNWGNFRVLRLWESDMDWESKLGEFLLVNK